MRSTASKMVATAIERKEETVLKALGEDAWLKGDE